MRTEETNRRERIFKGPFPRLELRFSGAPSWHCGGRDLIGTRVHYNFSLSVGLSVSVGLQMSQERTTTAACLLPSLRRGDPFLGSHALVRLVDESGFVRFDWRFFFPVLFFFAPPDSYLPTHLPTYPPLSRGWLGKKDGNGVQAYVLRLTGKCCLSDRERTMILHVISVFWLVFFRAA